MVKAFLKTTLRWLGNATLLVNAAACETCSAHSTLVFVEKLSLALCR